jgi:hypothetical protein
MAIPSSTRCGSDSSTARSMNAPGSPSSALQMTYFWSDGILATVDHFRPAGYPPPPRPRKPLISISRNTSARFISVKAVTSAR